ncbi:glycoside hydrolase family 71 protein [Tricholoma matsutake]|nr:glycoside hydrolase family 71 protein [Tricholoma matsutake 945]
MVSGALSYARPKLAVAHFMVGNTYKDFAYGDWLTNIALAASRGIDAFALNVGQELWQRDRAADAFAAAENFGPNFKLFMSFDMTSMPCTTADDANDLKYYINMFGQHPNYLVYDGKIFVSTFAGQSCSFGAPSFNEGWNNAVKSGPPVFFMPSFFIDPSSFNGVSVMDGAFNWNSGWPMGDYDINFDSDNDYIRNLPGRSYMAAVSPWFFTHYAPDSFNKNFIYRSDDWLLSKRWDMLVTNRESVDITQIVTWNDYGESHYIGPIAGDQPHSEAWTNGFDHQAWVDLIGYYIAAFKSGVYPTICRDRIFSWARLYPANADAPDSVGRPTHWEWTADYLWTVVFLTSSADVKMSCGDSVQTFTSLPPGSSKLKLPLNAECDVVVEIYRNGMNELTFKPDGFRFSEHPPNYNFNAFVASS